MTDRTTPPIAAMMKEAARGTGKFSDADRVIVAGALVSIAESLERIDDTLAQLVHEIAMHHREEEKRHD